MVLDSADEDSFDPGGEVSTILRNVGNCLPVETA